jgi:hypothetical protein
MDPMQIVNETSANNGDENLFVQFFKAPVKMEYKSEQEGRPIYEERLMVRIQSPGNNNNIVEREAWDGDKLRFPKQWLQFQVKGEQAGVEGTPIEQWPALNRAQVEELRAVRFYTVESIANASDAQLQGMGMGGQGLRIKAQAYLKAAQDTALVQKQAADLERRDSEIAELKSQVERLAALAEEKRGPGRPRKEAA